MLRPSAWFAKRGSDGAASINYAEANSRLSYIEKQLHDIQGDVHKNDREIADLQIQKSWIKNPSTLLALLALLFSVLTTVFTLYRQNQQDTQASRAELRSMLQRLSALPRDTVEASEKYKGSPNVACQISSMLNSEGQLIANQAAQIMRDNPSNISGTDYTLVAYALMNHANVYEAEEILDIAVNKSKSGPDKIVVYRTMEQLRFYMGQFDQARSSYNESVKETDLSFNNNAEAKYALQVENYLLWSEQELTYKNCDASREPLKQAAEYLARMNQTAPAYTLFDSRLKSAQSAALSCVTG
jgi:hypothetical protein